MRNESTNQDRQERRVRELSRLEEAAKQFLRDTGVGSIADHMSVHVWMAAFAYTELAKHRLIAFENAYLSEINDREYGKQGRKY